ncbi:MAG: hypothetical protein NC321_03315 [Clostridium sp.]|nr:hypothetical protein [Clostridium sp.]
MVFQKKGKICDKETFKDIPWYSKNIMKPVAYYMESEKILRLYVTLCDAENIGRIGYLDLNPENPQEILDYSRIPCIDIGKNGEFDSHGCVSACIYEEDGLMYMYYSGYSVSVDVPYVIQSGCAVCVDDDREVFKKLNHGEAILQLTSSEKYLRSNPYILKRDKQYALWYVGGDDWTATDKGTKPLYNIKYIQSKNKLQWNSQTVEIALDVLNSDCNGASIGTVWRDGTDYKMICCIRYLMDGYRLAYAVSKDGIHFSLENDGIQLVGENLDWDKEMQCFPCLFKYKDKTYLFYTGNHYGIGGLGYAELVEE